MQFHIIEGASVVLRSKGLFRQAKVFHLQGELFAEFNRAFIKLSGKQDTSAPSVTYQNLDVPFKPERDGVFGSVRAPLSFFEVKAA